MNLDDLKNTFFEECSDLMSELEEGLFSITEDDPDIEIVNSVFRAVHSVKGGAGSFGLEELVSFAHVFESSLDVLRQDISMTTDDRIKLLMKAADALTDTISAARDDTGPVDCSEIIQELETEFNLSDAEEEEIEYEAVPIDIAAMDLAPVATGAVFEIHFAPTPEMYLVGHDPKQVFRELRELGTCTIECNSENLPALDQYQTDKCYLTWNITLETEKLEDEIRAVFEWVEGMATLEIQGSAAEGEEPAVSLDDILAGFESPDDGGSEEADADADAGGGSLELLPAAEEDLPVLNEADAAPVEAVEAEKEEEKPAEKEKPAKGKNANQNSGNSSKTIRVESQKVDTMINLMGELVISQAMLTEELNMSNEGASSSVGLALAGLQNLTREIQASVMAIRAQPIKPVFMRMSRIIREICGATGKKANLVLEGEYTEVDSTVIEGLIDPLTHMIRNAVDHGIELPEKREEIGKPELGTILLSASHNSGSILIEIKDDGAGINRQKVFEKAVQAGIVAPDASLSDNEIDDLIFAPGFSTADEVTDLSGRGVGMDVVRQSIQAMGGRVSITSKPNEGSHFMLSLPLTLAILDGMVINDAEQVFVVPISSVIETLKVSQGDVFDIGNGSPVIKLRENLVPIIDVANELGFAEARSNFENCTILVVECGVNTLAALVVDSIVGQRQVVIKSLERNYQRVPGIAAATILGNGRIALVLDSDEIVRCKGDDLGQMNTVKMSA